MSPHSENTFKPFIPSNVVIPEATVRAVVTGTLLGMVFGASSLYLVLKVGITVSASIPVAVISIALFRLLSKFGVRDSTILENTTIQTAGSAGESLAFGVGVTMPAILLLGFDLETPRMIFVTLLGGLLGVLMMIPLRRALIVKEHGVLKYPEGTACAEVLKAGADPYSLKHADPAWRGGKGAALRSAADSGAGAIFAGFGIGLIYKILMEACQLWKSFPIKVFGPPLKGGAVAAEISPELLGVGYIIGPKIASIMLGGGVMAYWLLIPMIKFFGEGLPTPLAPGLVPISEMTPDDIRSAYVLYIGAGAVAAGGIFSLIKSLPVIWHGLRQGLASASGSRDAGPANSPRVDRDLSLKAVGIGIVAIIAAITLAPGLHMNLVGAGLVVVFGFLFVTVSSRLTGEIGSSSNPISGMTVATLLLTCLIFLALGWTGGTSYVTALSIGAIVCIASSNGGTTSQDLKTGYLVGATPRLQQIALLIGVVASALVLGPILMKLNQAATVYVPIVEVAPDGLATDPRQLKLKEPLFGPQASADSAQYLVWHKTNTIGGPMGRYLVDDSGKAAYLVDPGINGSHTRRPDGSEVRKFEAPKATLMSYIIKGILDRELPWGLVIFGAVIALILELSGIPSLAFAVGVYLHIGTSVPVFVGGMARWFVDRRRRSELARHNLSPEELAADADRSPGVLIASGYIAGGALAGIALALVAGVFPAMGAWLGSLFASNPFLSGDYADGLSLIPFGLIVAALIWVACRGGGAPKRAESE